jgi:hypothetical protein
MPTHPLRKGFIPQPIRIRRIVDRQNRDPSLPLLLAEHQMEWPIRFVTCFGVSKPNPFVDPTPGRVQETPMPNATAVFECLCGLQRRNLARDLSLIEMLGPKDVYVVFQSLKDPFGLLLRGYSPFLPRLSASEAGRVRTNGQGLRWMTHEHAHRLCHEERFPLSSW